MLCAGYVPPHSRRADGTSNAPAFSLNAEASGPAGRLGVMRPKPLVPGAAPPDTKSASKNASRRRSKKKGSGAEAADDADNDTSTPNAAVPAQSSQLDAVTNGRFELTHAHAPKPAACSQAAAV